MQLMCNSAPGGCISLACCAALLSRPLMLVRGSVGWASSCCFGGAPQAYDGVSQSLTKLSQCNGTQPFSRLLDIGEPPALQLQQLLRLQSAVQANTACASARQSESAELSRVGCEQGRVLASLLQLDCTSMHNSQDSLSSVIAMLSWHHQSGSVLASDIDSGCKGYTSL